MKTIRFLILAASAALLLSACEQRPPLTTEQVKSVVGLSMGEVDAKLGHANSITQAGKQSVWWEYIRVTRPSGAKDGSCHVIFEKGVVVRVKC